jgi:hypothetical protein
MEWAVVWTRRARNLARTLTDANGPKREREIYRTESVTAPVEMRQQKLAGGR